MQDHLALESSYRPQTAADQPADGTRSPMLVLGIMRRRKWSILVGTAVLSALVVVGASRLKLNFIATASVLMQQHNAGAMDGSAASGMVMTDSVAVRTQADILRSVDLARGVVRKMDLVDMPEFSPQPGALAKLLDRLGLETLRPPNLPMETREELAAQILLGMITVVNDGRSDMIDIKCKVSADGAADAERAATLSATLANAYADAYVEFTGKLKSDDVRQANSFFDNRIEALQQNMRATESAVQTYRLQHDLVENNAAGGGRSVTIIGQQMAQLNSDLISATSDRAKLDASLQQIAAGKNLQYVPEVVGSPLIQSLRAQQADLGGRAAALAMSRGTGSQDLMAVRASQRDVAAQIAAETAKIGASLRSADAAARDREATLRSYLADLQHQVGMQGQNEVELDELQNEADIARLLYSTYLKRFEETANQIGVQEPDASVVSRAGVPLGAAPPSKHQVIVAGVLVSFALATLLALLRERLQSGFRTSAELEASVGVETLGFVPKVRHPRLALRFEDRYSPFSESIFSIRALLRFKTRRGSQVVMVTSALPQEGKTFFALSLARNAAMADERVLLIDCDLRRPGVSRHVTTAPVQTYDNLTIRRDDLSRLDIITMSAGGSSPQDLFASPRMRDHIGMLRQRYDLIVLDTPPVLAVSDARVLSALSDVTLLVVCWQKTAQHLVNRAVSALRNSGVNVVGTVVTQVKLRDLDASEGGSGYFYSNFAGIEPDKKQPSLAPAES